MAVVAAAVAEFNGAKIEFQFIVDDDDIGGGEMKILC